VTTYPLNTCFHEAGHAVVAAALGVEVGDLHVNADDESGGAENDGGAEIGCHGDLPDIDRAAICFAGDKAQDIWHPSQEWGGASDYAKFRELFNCYSDEDRDALEDAGCKRANELLLAHKALVEIVAQLLSRQGRLTAAEFKRLTRGLEPGPLLSKRRFR
jgi:hypothetical protein